MSFSSEILYTSSKKFVLWDYVVSHGQLLLRADKINEEKGFNVDIIFFDTAYVQLPAGFANGISISEDSDNKRFGYDKVDNGLDKKYQKCFEIKSDGASYYIVASFFRVFENELSFSETSLGVLQYKGREKEIARSF